MERQKKKDTDMTGGGHLEAAVVVCAAADGGQRIPTVLQHRR